METHTTFRPDEGDAEKDAFCGLSVCRLAVAVSSRSWIGGQSLTAAASTGEGRRTKVSQDSSFHRKPRPAGERETGLFHRPHLRRSHRDAREVMPVPRL